MNNAHCACGSVSYEIVGKPLIRAFCHCTICQKLNSAPYADIVVFKEKDVLMPGNEHLAYKAQRFPPLLQRGQCTSCQNIAIEYVNLGPFPKLIAVPSKNIDDQSLIPEPSLHIFYDTRVKDIDDNLPKHSGYLSSQFAFSKALITKPFQLKKK